MPSLQKTIDRWFAAQEPPATMVQENDLPKNPFDDEIKGRIHSIVAMPPDTRQLQDLEWCRQIFLGLGYIDKLPRSKALFSIRNMEMMAIRRKKTLFRRKHPCEYYYLVLAGSLHLSRTTKLSMQSQEILEGGVITETGYSANGFWTWDSVVSSKKADLLVIPRDVYLQCCDEVTGVSLTARFLRTLFLFENWEWHEIIKVAEKMTRQCFKKKTKILDSNDSKANSIYFVRRGVCEFSRLRGWDPETANQFCEGYQLGPQSVFGERLLFRNTEHYVDLAKYDVWSVTDVDVMIVEASLFSEMIQVFNKDMQPFLFECKNKAVGSGHECTNPSRMLASPSKIPAKKKGFCAGKKDAPPLSPEAQKEYEELDDERAEWVLSHAVPPEPGVVVSSDIASFQSRMRRMRQNPKEIHIPSSKISRSNTSSPILLTRLKQKAKELPFTADLVGAEEEDILSVLEHGTAAANVAASQVVVIKTAVESPSSIRSPTSSTKITSPLSPLSPPASSPLPLSLEHSEKTQYSTLPLIATQNMICCKRDPPSNIVIPRQLEEATLPMYCEYTKGYIRATIANLEHKSRVEWKISVASK